MSFIFLQPKTLLMSYHTFFSTIQIFYKIFVKIHFSAYSCEHQNFIVIGLVFLVLIIT